MRYTTVLFGFLQWKVSQLISLVLIFTYSLHLNAAEIIDTSRTIILSEDTNLNDTYKIRQAFARILSINTGESVFDILQNPYVIEANPRSAVKRAYVEEIDKKYLPENSDKKYWYHVVMEENYILDIIQKAGFSLLPHKRDEIMLWLVNEEWIAHDEEFMLQPERVLDYAYSDEKFMYWFNHWAESKGLVFSRPDLDEIDMLVVTPQSIKTLSFEADEQSKNRYDAKQSVLIYFQIEDDEIKVRMGYFDKDSRISIKHYQEADQDISHVLFSVMEDLSELYSLDYKISGQDLQNHSQQIVVDSINDYDTVRLVEKYFSDLSIVTDYEIVTASKGQLTLNLELIVTTEAFLQIISRDNQLEMNPLSNMNSLIFSVRQPEE